MNREPEADNGLDASILVLVRWLHGTENLRHVFVPETLTVPCPIPLIPSKGCENLRACLNGQRHPTNSVCRPVLHFNLIENGTLSICSINPSIQTATTLRARCATLQKAALVVKDHCLPSLPAKVVCKKRESKFFAGHGNNGRCVFPTPRWGNVEESQEVPARHPNCVSHVMVATSSCAPSSRQRPSVGDLDRQGAMFHESRDDDGADRSSASASCWRRFRVTTGSRSALLAVRGRGSP